MKAAGAQEHLLTFSLIFGCSFVVASGTCCWESVPLSHSFLSYSLPPDTLSYFLRDAVMHQDLTNFQVQGTGKLGNQCPGKQGELATGGNLRF